MAKKANRGLHPRDPKRIRHTPLPHRIPEWVSKIFTKETTTKKALKRRSWETWREKVDQIEDEDVRAKVGCIVFWDFMADEEGPCETNLFDHFLAARVDPELEPALVANALHAIGYTPQQAFLRAKPPANQDQDYQKAPDREYKRPGWIGGTAVGQHAEKAGHYEL